MFKHGQERQLHFSLRKTTLGIASVIIGATIYMGGNTVQAADNSNNDSIPSTQESKETKENATNSRLTSTATPILDSKNTSTSTTAAKATEHISQDKSTIPIYDNKGLTFSSDINANGVAKTDNQIIDANKTNGQITVNSTINNPSNTDQKADVIITLPKFRNKDTNKNQATAVLTGPISVSNIENPAIRYSINPGMYYTMSELQASGNFSWDKVIAIQVIGVVSSNTSAEINATLQISNLEQIKTDLNNIIKGTAEADLTKSSLRHLSLGVSTYYWDGNNKFKSANSTNKDYYVEIPDTEAMNNIQNVISNKTKWTATTLKIEKDGTFVYTSAPKTIQDILPPLSKDDFSFYNVNSTSPANVLYTDGSYRISLEKVFNILKNYGYSVNILPDKQNIWPYYSYLTVRASSSDKYINNSQTSIYLEVQQIFNTKDLTIKDTDNWNSNDNLVSAQATFTSRSTMHVTGKENLKNSGNYTYQLLDANNKVVYDSSSLANGNSKTLSAGNYTIVYSYTINPSHVVTSKANLVVTSTSTPTTDPQPAPNPQPSPDPDPIPQPKPEPIPTPDPDHHSQDNSNDDQPAPKPHPTDNPNKQKNSNSATKHSNKATDNFTISTATTSQKLAFDTKNSKKVTVVQNDHAKASTLPQTGVRKNSLAILGLGLIALLSYLGIERKKKN